MAHSQVNDGLELGRLAEEQAALRRVATLVAQGAPRRSLFTAVAEQVASVLDVRVVSIVRYAADDTATEYASVSDRGEFFPVGTRWSLAGTNVVAQVRQSGRPARIEDYSGLEGAIAEAVRNAGIRSTVGAPIVVAGDVWGVMVVSSTESEPLPADTEARLTGFTELVATAIANADARAEVERLADGQAALRRVATLVAEGVPPSGLFGAVAKEAGRLLRGVDVTVAIRFESDTAGTVVGEWGDPDPAGFLGDRLTMEGDGVAALVLRTGQPARVDDYSKATGSTAALVREKGVRTALGVPIIVEGRLWGAFIVASRVAEPLPADTEPRVEGFTELVATAIANAEARAEVERLADEQAALRRVATLVAKGVPPSELFASVAEETGRLMRADGAVICRYEADGGASVVAGWGVPDVADLLGTRVSLARGGAMAEVRRTGRPARIDDYSNSAAVRGALARARGVRAGVGVPIVVEGRLWGAMVASSRQAGALPPGVEPRIGEFTELVATAISNTEARTEVERLADEQAALRRVATLVANGVPPNELFASVAEETGRLMRADVAAICRYEPDGGACMVASWGLPDVTHVVGTRRTVDRGGVVDEVRRTGRPARIDDYASSGVAMAAMARTLGVQAGVAVPIVVEGRLWGAMVANSRQAGALPPDVESRIGEFTELVATAISNTQARADLAASRARLVAASDEERQRVVRDLHDGAQQRLVLAVVTLKLARRALEEEEQAASGLVTEALQHAEEANVELRELAHGILPAVLTRGGLRAGVAALASRAPLPVENGVSVGRLPTPVEATAYFVVAEALTNVVKHSHATRAVVTARVEDATLDVAVSDDGVGGARADGSGLVGLGDRLAALDGRLRVQSPADGGTLIAAAIPLPR